MMNSFYWTQSLLVIVVAILAFFISFGPSLNRAKWLKALGIAASLALFIVNFYVMHKTGDGLDKQLNCWLLPDGVDCPEPAAAVVPIVPSNNATAPKLSAQDLSDQGKAAYQAEDFIKARAAYWAGDVIRARALFKKACDGLNGASCNMLGLMWATGEGGGRDAATAKELYELACAYGDDFGCINASY